MRKRHDTIPLLIGLLFFILLISAGCANSTEKSLVENTNENITIGSTINKEIDITFKTEEAIQDTYDYSEFNNEFWWYGTLDISNIKEMPSGAYYVTYSGQLTASN
ncbi:MAG: hypothetical protein PWP51_1033 [Clostridiales bacterium]|nr:hypothetical protein [Clostridiales bacterium]